jgi:outer membrane immunogenic protein
MFSKALVVSLFAVAAATSAMAADTVPPASAPPMFTPTVSTASVLGKWTGFYVGGDLGAGFNTVQHNTVSGPALGSFGQVGTIGATSFVGSVRVGYDYQFSSVVVGAVSDVAYNSADKTDVYGYGASTLGFKSETPFYGTVRVRAGYAFDRALVYATGGYAYGDTVSKFGYSDPVNGATDASKTAVKSGWAGGAGVEYQLAPHWSTGVEYLHVALDPNKFHDVQSLFYNSYRPQVDEVKAGVNYKW